jgi:hypothetical protein
MITPRDLRHVAKLALMAQMLEMLGNEDKPAVRCPDVFASMSQELWQVFLYLKARLHDELFASQPSAADHHYQRELEVRTREGLDGDDWKRE